MKIEKREVVYWGKHELPVWLFKKYELGRHWPESGSYEEWRKEKLDSFCKTHILSDEVSYSGDSGATTLIVEGAPKDDIESFIAGKVCPDCGFGSLTGDRDIDDIALHLTDRHGWDCGAVLSWLRDKVEAKAFNEEA